MRVYDSGESRRFSQLGKLVGKKPKMLVVDMVIVNCCEHKVHVKIN